jgi:uncharacterized protein (DUF433 family)
MFDRITRNPEILNGQPCIRDLRLSVKRVLEILAVYDDRKELFKEYPELEEIDLKQALEYAAASLADKIIDSIIKRNIEPIFSLADKIIDLKTA